MSLTVRGRAVKIWIGPGSSQTLAKGQDPASDSNTFQWFKWGGIYMRNVSLSILEYM